MPTGSRRRCARRSARSRTARWRAPRSGTTSSTTTSTTRAPNSSCSIASSPRGNGSGSTSVGKPVVGITTYLTPAAWGAWNLEAALVPAAYVRAVERAGGVPLLVPPGASFDETLDRVDGMVFSGGSDVDPELYGATAHEETVG